MTVPTLFPDEPDPQPDKTLPHNGTPTSRLAAKLATKFAGTHRERVFQFIAQTGQQGSTNEETSKGTGISCNSVQPRTNELVKLGRVKASGNMRPTESGTPATVWVAVAPDERTAERLKADWPTNGRTNPSRNNSDCSAPDMIS